MDFTLTKKQNETKHVADTMENNQNCEQLELY